MVQRRHPFPEACPEFSIFETDAYCEHRVENWHLSRDGSGLMISGTTIFTLQDAILLILNGYIYWMSQSFLSLAGNVFLLLVLMWLKCSQVLYESVIVVPPHGVQLETHRGLPGFRIFTTRRFIRLKALQDVVIHEGLKGWDVRYYLAAIKCAVPGSFTLEIAYENLLPQHRVLLFVQRSIKEQFWGQHQSTNTIR